MTQSIKVHIEEGGKLRDATIPETIAALLLKALDLRDEYCNTVDLCEDCAAEEFGLCGSFPGGHALTILQGNNPVFEVVELEAMYQTVVDDLEKAKTSKDIVNIMDEFNSTVREYPEMSKFEDQLHDHLEHYLSPISTIDYGKVCNRRFVDHAFGWFNSDVIVRYDNGEYGAIDPSEHEV